MAQRKDDRRILTPEEHRRLASRPLAIYLRLLKAVEEQGGVPDDLAKILDPDPQYANACVTPLFPKCAQPAPPRKTVKIPNKSVTKLLAWIRTECVKQGISSDFLNWDLPKWKKLLAQARGKEFEVITHAFSRDWYRRDAKRIHEEQRCDGNPVAFVFWTLMEQQRGWFITVPNDENELFPCVGYLYAPCFLRDELYCKFHLHDVHGKWHDDDLLIAFRAIVPSEPVVLK